MEKKIMNAMELNQSMRINVEVMGRSCDPISFVVRPSHSVSSAIKSALAGHARLGRLPALGFEADHFLLYGSTQQGWKVMEPTDRIGSLGFSCRNFMLCLNSSADTSRSATITTPTTRCRPRRTFKNWFCRRPPVLDSDTEPLLLDS